MQQWGGWLYDNREDPYQLRHEVGDPAFAEVRGRLDAKLDRWLMHFR